LRFLVKFAEDAANFWTPYLFPLNRG
jgi:hypothetical protein